MHRGGVVSEPLTVNLYSPPPGADAHVSATFTFNAGANPKPDSLDFLISQSGINPFESVPGTYDQVSNSWSGAWDTTMVQNGHYYVTARARKIGAADALTAPAAITVENDAPIISILSPEAGASLSGTTELKVTTGHPIEAVAFSLTGQGEALSLTAAPDATMTYWSASLDLSALKEGSYTLGASATWFGAMLSAAPVAVTVMHPVIGTQPTATGPYSPQAELLATTTINVDQGLAAPPSGPTPCVSGSLIRGSLPAVYYCGADGKRYVFPTEKIYFSWYSDFGSVVTIPDATLAVIPLGGNVSYRPGFRMIKITSDPKTYAVSRGCVLRWVTTEALAASLYGLDWNTKIDDIPDTEFANCTVGADITE